MLYRLEAHSRMSDSRLMLKRFHELMRKLQAYLIQNETSMRSNLCQRLVCYDRATAPDYAPTVAMLRALPASD
jgi:hypothetical protein